MKKEYFQILCRVGGISKKDKTDAKHINKEFGKGQFLGGCTRFGVRKDSGEKVFKIFLNSRQSDPDFLESFIHEMLHVVIHLMGLRLNRKDQEFLAHWAGYLSRLQFAYVMPKKFARREQ